MSNWFKENKNGLLELFLIALFIYVLLFLIGTPFACNKYADDAQMDIEAKTVSDNLQADDDMMDPGPDPEITLDTDGMYVARMANTATAVTWERMMYVDKTDTLYNNVQGKNTFSRYLKSYGFNGVYLYSTSGILSSSSNYAAFSSFLKQLSDSGIVYRAVCNGSATTFGATGNVTRYNASQSDPNRKINVANLELEWWNSACTWSTWDYTNQQVNSGTIATNDFYEGWYKNLGVTVDTVASRQQVIFSDRILLHCYQAGYPTYSYANAISSGATGGRLDIIAKGARQANKKIDLYIIISSENTAWGASNTFSGPVLAAAINQANPFAYVETQAYNSIYVNMTAFQKQWINFKGFIWFTKRYCYAAIPPK